MRLFSIIAGLALLFAAPIPLSSDQPLLPICRLGLEEEQRDRETIALELDLARSELVAAEEVYQLVDSLWKNDAIERLGYLTGKHQRDRAAVDVERLEQLTKRQDALMVQYRLICEAEESGARSEEERRAIDRAWQDYRRAECEVHARKLALAEIDLAYHLEVLASFRDLREHDVATRQDVVFSERDVEMSRKRKAQAKQLVEACRQELAEE